MKRLAVLPIILVLAAVSAGAVPLTDMNYLRSINCDGAPGNPTVELSFDLKAGLANRTVAYSDKHNYVLVTLPATYVNPAKRVISVNHPAIETILAAQRDAETTAVKIQLADGAWIASGGLSASVEDGRLRVNMKTDGTVAPRAKTAVEEPAEATPAVDTTAAASADETASAAADVLTADVKDAVGLDLKSEFEKQKVREEALIEAINEEPAEDDDAALFDFGAGEVGEESDAPTMRGSMIKLVAAFCLVIGAILIGSQWMKRNDWTKKALGLGDEVIKVVGTHNLGLKRSLMVVEIEGEKIVLAATGSDVRFLTKVGRGASESADAPKADAKTIAFAEHLARSRGGDEGYRRAAAGAPEITPDPIEGGDTVTAIRKRIASLKKL